MAPPATCVVPIGEELIVAGLKRRFLGGDYFSTTRPPAVYRGNPFVVEVRHRLRRRSASRRAGRGHALRQPRAAAVPAQGVRHQRGGLRAQLEELRARAAARLAAGRRRWPSSCTWRACGFPSPAKPKKPSLTTPSSCARSRSRSRNAGASWRSPARASARRERGASARAFSSATSPSSARVSARSPGRTATTSRRASSRRCRTS